MDSARSVHLDFDAEAGTLCMLGVFSELKNAYRSMAFCEELVSLNALTLNPES